ncbi:AsmA-like C-terminal domain-containing protein [Rhizobium tubonense]|uniref:YhdP family protein n=1 Tax=Rhizobium tubonense TaxID=484088 RepID=UPI0018A7EE75|nr:AsmA-like C-terminal domain-containing protein [Rhizobium tubonense]
MGVIRGEKVTFRKKDLVPLEDLPSSQVEDPMVVNCPPRRRRSQSHIWHVCRMTFVFGVFILLIIGAIVGTVESGVFDEPLSRKAQEALDAAIGPRYKAEVGTTVVRFTSHLRLALEARNVNVVDQESGKHLSTMGAVRMVLDPLALVEGRFVVVTVQASGIALDTALLPSGDPIDPANLRVDDIPVGIEEIFSNLDLLQHFAERGGTDAVEISGLALKIARQDGGAPLSVVVNKLTFTRPGPNSLDLKGQLSIDGAVATLDVIARQEADRPSSLTATLSHLDLTPLTLAYDALGQPRQGINSFADVTVTAVRGSDSVQPKLKASIDLKPGQIYMDRDRQDLSGASINLAYNPDHKTLEIDKSVARFQATTVPFTGALIDLDRIDPTAEKGFGVDFLISGGSAAPVASGEAPLSFDGQANGRYMSAAKELQLDKVGIITPLGSLFGSLHMRLRPGSPEISFAAQADTLQTAAVKQLWPFWMAPKARTWAQTNLFGGTITNGTISVFIPEGKLAQAAKTGDMRLAANELHIAFDIAGTRLNVPGEIPPIRDTVGHFDLSGPTVKVDIASGTSYFASGRSAALGPSTFFIPETHDKPLMAQMKLAVSGTGDAIGELLTFKPLRVLQRTEFKPEDFNGKIQADVQATIGLVDEQKPPPPVWKATLHLDDVDVLRPFDGRRIFNLNGRIDADPQQVHLNADAQIDGVPAKIDMIEPTEANSGVKRQRVITATLTDQQRDKVMPGLSDIVNGPVALTLTRIDDDRQNVKIDLTKASLTMPVIGWSKGSGISASAEFEASGPPDQTSLKNFSLKGDGFGANGDLVVSKGGLSSADFSSVKLSGIDDFALAVKRGKGSYDVSVSGDSADVRPILARMKSPSGGVDNAAVDVTVHAKLDKVVGFNDESIGNFKALFAISDGHVTAADLSGVTRSGEAVVSEMTKGGANGTIHVTSGDAGAIARFADIYRHMRGGLLNLSLRSTGEDSWDGSLDIRRFSITNEKRLQSIVSTPSGRNGQSLNSAVKQNIDTSAQNFQRAFARLFVRKGVVAIENGVVRGDQVGATFQGTVKDKNGNTDMTGTFMPAYGLNRLFAELPIIGFILGNGSDRGLIGITFKLTGDFDAPNLQINPLSIIAPGVFRQIFEFQ